MWIMSAISYSGRWIGSYKSVHILQPGKKKIKIPVDKKTWHE